MDVTSKKSILKIQNELEKTEIFINILINNAALNPKVEKNESIESLTRLENFSLDNWNKEI